MVLDFAKDAVEKCIGLKVGDRVRVINTVDGHDLVGKLGTVKAINDSPFPIGVAFDDYFSAGHGLDSNCENGHGRWGKESEFILISRAKEIVPKQLEGGKTTMKYIYEVIVVDRKINEVLLQETIIATSESNATFLIGLNHADTFEKVVLDNLDFTILSKGSYNEVKETKVVLENLNYQVLLSQKYLHDSIQSKKLH